MPWEGVSAACEPRRLKKGFLVSVSGLVTGKLVWTAGGEAAVGAAGEAGVTGGTATGAGGGGGGDASLRSSS